MNFSFPFFTWRFVSNHSTPRNDTTCSLSNDAIFIPLSTLWMCDKGLSQYKGG